MIKREILDRIKKWLNKDKILIIKWPRQVWKTTIIKTIKDELDKSWYKTLYFSADKELWNPIFNDVKLFIKYIYDQFDLQNRAYIFIDEFQYIEQAGLFMKVLFDEFKWKIQFIVSGSSSLEITKNTEFLTWRKIDFFVYPVSFFEFINYKSENTYKKVNIYDFKTLNYIGKIYKQDILQYLLEYLNYGWYPEICTLRTEEEKSTVLKEIVSTYIEKDIAWFLKIGNIPAFNNLIKLLANWVWNLVNKLELTNILNINYETLMKYLDILEWTYVLKFIKPYFKNIRKELSKMPKVFINDIWVANSLLWRKFDNLDFVPWNLIENYVYNIFFLNFDFDQIYFYRTISKAEIDFVISTPNLLVPIEVKYRKISKIPVIMQNFSKQYDVDFKLVVTKDYIEREDKNLFIPFYLLWFIDFTKT